MLIKCQNVFSPIMWFLYRFLPTHASSNIPTSARVSKLPFPSSLLFTSGSCPGGQSSAAQGTRGVHGRAEAGATHTHSGGKSCCPHVVQRATHVRCVQVCAWGVLPTQCNRCLKMQCNGVYGMWQLVHGVQLEVVATQGPVTCTSVAPAS